MKSFPAGQIDYLFVSRGKSTSLTFVNLFDLDRPEFVPKVGGRCMKMNPDGFTLAIGDRNGNIRIFDLQTFKQTAIVEAHDSEVLSVDYGQSVEMGQFI